MPKCATHCAASRKNLISKISLNRVYECELFFLSFIVNLVLLQPSGTCSDCFTHYSTWKRCNSATTFHHHPKQQKSISFFNTHIAHIRSIFGAIIFVIGIVGSTSWRIDKMAKVWIHVIHEYNVTIKLVATTIATSHQNIPIFYFAPFFRFWYHRNFTNIKSKYVISVLIFIYMFVDIHNTSAVAAVAAAAA